MARAASARPSSTTKQLFECLGPPRFEYGELEAEDQIGSATGLVVTEVGGDVIAIEATRMEGKEDFILTGQLGEVMRESARAGLSWIRRTRRSWGSRAKCSRSTPCTSTFRRGHPQGRPVGRHHHGHRHGQRADRDPVRKDLAMTGEITLRGRVLPIGGLKSKILAAHLAGAKTVMLPQKNEKDLLDIPEEIRKQMKLVLVDSMEQVLATALRRKPAALKAPPAEVVERGDELREQPAAPDKLRRGFPGPEQPPAVAEPTH